MQSYVRNSDALMRHASGAYDRSRKRWYVQTPDFYVPAWRAFVEIKAREPGAHTYDIGRQTSERIARLGVERFILVRGEPSVGWVDAADYTYGNGIAADATIFLRGRVVGERCRLGIVDDDGAGRLDWIRVTGGDDAVACLHPDLIGACIAIQEREYVPPEHVEGSRRLVRSLHKIGREALGAFAPCSADRANELYSTPRYRTIPQAPAPKRARLDRSPARTALPTVLEAKRASCGDGDTGKLAPAGAVTPVEYDSAEEDARAGFGSLTEAELAEIGSYLS